MSEGLVLKLLFILLTIVLNAIYVAAEFSLARTSPSRVEARYRGKSFLYPLLKNALGRLNDYISAAQVGITVSSLALGYFSEQLFTTMLDPVLSATGMPPGMTHTVSFLLAITLATAVHVSLGEFVPKTVAIQFPEAVAIGTILPLDFSYRLTKPFVYVLTQTSNLMLRLVGIRVENPTVAYSEEEIKYLITQSQVQGHIEETEREMVNNVFELNDMVVREVMTPRTKVVGLEDNLTILDAALIATREKFSKLPVYRENLDDTLGIVSITEILKSLQAGRGEQPVTDIVGEVMRVPENKSLVHLLSDFQIGRSQIAVVLDEFGGTAGLVTMEDIIEELVGEIRDEHDGQEEGIKPIKEATYLIDASTPIYQVNEELGTQFDDEYFDTIGGFVFGLIGREAQKGDQVQTDNCLFTVEAASHHRVDSVLLEFQEPETASQENAIIQPEEIESQTEANQTP